MTNLDRSEINRALAKAIAYKQCGKDLEARKWAAALVGMLECASILNAAAYEDARLMRALNEEG
jgi:hypothetical protein